MVINQTFFVQPAASQENVARQLLRLLWNIHHRIQPEKLDSLMDAVKPSEEVDHINILISRRNIFIEIMETKGFFQSEIIINVLVITSCFI